MKLSKKVGTVGTHSARAKRTKPRRFRRGLVTTLAVLVSLLPVGSMGYLGWAVYRNVFHDSRPTASLSYVNRSITGLTPFSTPMVSVTFDDGWESAYKNAAPVLSQYNIPSTFYIITDTFNDPQYLSTDQIKSLLASGHQIESHTVTHPNLTQVNDTQLGKELSNSKNTLQKLVNGPVTDFSSPLDAYNDHVIAAIKAQGYRSHRTTDADLTRDPYNLNLASTFNPYRIQAYTVRNTTTTQQLQDYLAYARENKAWVVLVYHQVESSKVEVPEKDRYAVSLNAFKEQMKLVNESNMRVVTMEQALDAIAKQPAVPSQGDTK
ncbi:MAG TPA: polysaccharide deacetylase family protein [Candidatus Saccharimonadales bacterium]|nr:polysaccharide deacetylase family protein [Candidatus Saccharimonadales bacterium]